MSINGNINDEKLGILNSNGTMNVNELWSGVQATWNINDLRHGSIINSSGEFFINVIPS